MRGKETQPTYIEGQEVQVNLSSNISPEWMSAKVVDLNPETESLLVRGFEKFLGLDPIVVRVNKEAPAWAGAKIKAYTGGSKIRPVSVE